MKKSKYKYVRQMKIEGKLYWVSDTDKNRWPATFKTEREAALNVDLTRIKRGLPPVNILKPKTNA